MDELVTLVEFSLTSDNFVLAAGEPWRRGDSRGERPFQCTIR